MKTISIQTLEEVRAACDAIVRCVPVTEPANVVALMAKDDGVTEVENMHAHFNAAFDHLRDVMAKAEAEDKVMATNVADRMALDKAKADFAKEKADFEKTKAAEAAKVHAAPYPQSAADVRADDAMKAGMGYEKAKEQAGETAKVNAEAAVPYPGVVDLTTKPKV